MLKNNIKNSLIASMALAPAGGFVLLIGTFLKSDDLSTTGFLIMVAGSAMMIIGSLLKPMLVES